MKPEPCSTSAMPKASAGRTRSRPPGRGPAWRTPPARKASTASRPTREADHGADRQLGDGQADHVEQRRSRAPGSTSMKPSTSTTATGSLRPDSASRIRARRLSRLEPRSTEKIAALSVAATIEPSRRPSSGAQVEQPGAPRARRSPPWRRSRPSPATRSARSTRADLVPARGQSALEQDEAPARRPRRAGQLDVVLACRRSRSGRARRSRAAIPRPRNSTRPGTRRRPGHQRRTDPGREQRARQQQEESAVAHGPVSSRRRRPAARRARPGPTGRATRGRATAPGRGAGSRVAVDPRGAACPARCAGPMSYLKPNATWSTSLGRPRIAASSTRREGRGSGL